MLVALLLVSPHWLKGFPDGHNLVHNVSWQESFTAQLFEGELMPRWLFGLWDGLGAPVFYFYAPLPFYLFSLVAFFPFSEEGLVTLSVGHIALFFLSGFAFYAWMRRFVDPFWAASAATLYMVVPYHYIDVEVRASMGESFAYVWLPLILIGICRPDKTWRATLLAAVGYAFLILSHLPSALLAAPAIALCAVLSGGRSAAWRAFRHTLVVGGLGLALSAFYALPALLLRDTLPFDPWVVGSGEHFRAVGWLLGLSDIPSFGHRVYRALGATTGLALGFVVLDFATRDNKAGATAERRHEHINRTMSLVLAFCWFLMSILSWPVWRYLPFLSTVQFPWRQGFLVDVTAVTLVGLHAPGAAGRLVDWLRLEDWLRRAVLSGFVVIASSITLILVVNEYFPGNLQTKVDYARDPILIEYRPKWLVESPVYLGANTKDDLEDIDTAVYAHRDGVVRWDRYVETLPQIAALRPLERGESVAIRDVAITRAAITAILSSPATIRTRKLYYPHWHLADGTGSELEVTPDGRTGLLSFVLPSGRHELVLRRQWLPVEYVGILLSIVAAVGIAAGAVCMRLRESRI